MAKKGIHHLLTTNTNLNKDLGISVNVRNKSELSKYKKHWSIFDGNNEIKNSQLGPPNSAKLINMNISLITRNNLN